MHLFEEILVAADDGVRYVDRTLREEGALTAEARDVLENLAAVMETRYLKSVRRGRRRADSNAASA